MSGIRTLVMVLAGALVNTDPSQYPDENPCSKAGGSSPTVQGGSGLLMAVESILLP